MPAPLVEIKLNSYTYRFRRLRWGEEALIRIPAGVDPRIILLAHALTDVSGMPVTEYEDALKVLKAIPHTLRWRIWIVYKGNLPEDRFYTSRGLFQAPDFTAYNKRLIADGEATEPEPDTDLIRKFGANEAFEARQLEEQMLRNAKKDRAERG